LQKLTLDLSTISGWLSDYSAIAGGVTVVASHLLVVHNKLSGIAARFAKIDDIQQRITAMEKEIQPNGGSSMRDAITRSHDEVMFISQLVKLTTNQATTPVLLFDREGQCTWINQPALERLRLERLDYKGSGWLGAFKNSTDLREDWADAVRTNSTWLCSAVLLDGSSVQLQIQITQHQNKVLGWMGTLAPLDSIPRAVVS
jgi:hypothetical protein